MLLDRADQRRALEGALASAAAGRGRSVLVTGAPGDGASALLHETARSAASGAGRWLVLAARGAPDERDLENALLQQLLLPLLDEADALGVALDTAPRAALETAVGRRAALPGHVPLPMAVLLALETVGRRRPVLVVVDGAHWADPSSAAVLRFLGRRLSRTAVCLVLAAPAQAAEGWTDVDSIVALTPLGRGAVLAVVDEQLPDLDPVVRDLLAELAQGRPRRLADLLDVARTGAGASTASGLVPALRGVRSPSLQRAREALAGSTEPERQRLLLRGLVDDLAALPHLEEAAALLEGAGEGAARSAGSLPDGLERLSRGSDGLDRLLVAVAVAEAEPREVRRARVAWFDVLCREVGPDGPADGADERVVRLAGEARRQRAHLVHGSDSNLAAGLRRSARGLLRFDARRAGDLFALAATVDGDPARRSASLLLSAEQARLCGRGTSAPTRPPRGAGTPEAAGLAERLEAVGALEVDDHARAERHLERALGHLAQAVPTAADQAAAVDEVLVTAVVLLLVAGRRPAVGHAVESAAALLPAPAAERLQTLQPLSRPWAETTPEQQGAALAEAVAVLETSSLPVLRWAADTARVLGRLDLVQALLERRDRAQPVTGPGAVDHHLAAAAAWLDVSVDRAGEHLRRARTALRHAPGRTEAVGQAEALLTLLRDGSASAGEPPEAVALPATTEVAGALWSTAHRHRLRGEMREAAALLLRLWPPAPQVPGPDALANALPLAYALLEAEGDGPALRRVVEEVSAWARGSGAPLATTTALLCRAVASTDADEKVELIAKAARSASTPVVAGPAELALGMVLRRARQGVSAREPLQRAVDAYEQVGQRAFAELARRELAATAPQRPPRRVGSSVLTSQERVVADLAAQGVSNAEIALSLGISSRTVAHHLQHVYAKLGITGRRQLPGRLARADS